ncbi:NAD(P)/FAD-dependent oxidoreductase [Dyella choica]|uniref:NAD(P)/FAD-dependent oxidoreductase n=1 Tax=Dyella choica TaxID=1927959 RepID=A0A3S0WY22_9GAMM|nr:NAD(P)/FAD-dependent oxidoreductase [Dyella choica]RUL78823.1 NAD(P)/FAD-dependent oxidoreductase [Dyella choica]
MKQPTRIVIAGGGIAGILLATKLGDQLGRTGDATVTLIDRSPTHIWKPMLHTIAAGTRNVNQQSVIYLAHARRHGFTYQPGEMCGLDRERREVQLAAINTQEGNLLIEPRAVPYDVLLLCLGSRANDFGTPGVRQHCHLIDSQQQAETFNVALRERALRCAIKDEQLRIAIVGAGATGVELSAELSRLFEIAAGYRDSTIRERMSLTILEAGPRVLAAFPPEISSASQQRLEDIGFRVLTSTSVSSAEPGGFRYGDGKLAEADLMVWAAGVKAPDFMKQLGGLETNRANQVVVSGTLQALHDESIFALGDCAALTPEGAQRPLPPTAQVATEQAEHLALHLPDWLRYNRPVPCFQFQDFGSLVSLSDYDAFGRLGRVGFFPGGLIRGRLAQLSHVMLYRRHQLALHGLGRATLLWMAEQINRLAQPGIRLA